MFGCVYLRTCSTILDLACVETLLIKVLHAGKHPCATEAHWVDGALLMERHSVCDDLQEMQTAHQRSLRVVVFRVAEMKADTHFPEAVDRQPSQHNGEHWTAR